MNKWLATDHSNSDSHCIDKEMLNLLCYALEKPHWLWPLQSVCLQRWSSTWCFCLLKHSQPSATSMVPQTSHWDICLQHTVIAVICQLINCWTTVEFPLCFTVFLWFYFPRAPPCYWNCSISIMIAYSPSEICMYIACQKNAYPKYVRPLFLVWLDGSCVGTTFIAPTTSTSTVPVTGLVDSKCRATQRQLVPTPDLTLTTLSLPQVSGWSAGQKPLLPPQYERQTLGYFDKIFQLAGSNLPIYWTAAPARLIT